jgi:hypothetical protein
MVLVPLFALSIFNLIFVEFFSNIYGFVNGKEMASFSVPGFYFLLKLVENFIRRGFRGEQRGANHLCPI